jgi:hypothetical protein
MGFAPERVEHLRLAAGLGVGSMDLASSSLREIGKPPAGPAPVPASLARLSARVEARDACSACYGGLLHALRRLEQDGALGRVPGPLRVGQGFRSSAGAGFGIGSCAKGFRHHVGGCPPSAAAILEFLKTHA